MIKIKTLTARNFMSIGNQTQIIDFSSGDLTLVLGENLDLGGDDAGARNGVGKTTVLNALSYALFGQALTNIKRNNLINNINGKNMLVTLEFEKNEINYRIERGRSPNVMKLYVNGQEKDLVDESQGDSRKTQESLHDIVGLSHDMFKHVVALNTYSEPFLSMRVADQRSIIEQLLGVTILTEKAEGLKKLIKATKDQITEEDIKIKAIQASNDKIQTTIKNLEKNRRSWNLKHTKEISDLNNSIKDLEKIDIEEELKNHDLKVSWKDAKSKLDGFQKDIKGYRSQLSRAQKSHESLEKDMRNIDEKVCYACGQAVHDNKAHEIFESKKKDFEESAEFIEGLEKKIEALTAEMEKVGDIGAAPSTFYPSMKEAYDHRMNVESLKALLEQRSKETDPYTSQIEELEKSAIQEVSWDTINALTSTKEHQEFLLRLLTNKDSFIRKKIIDQNLSFLNKRLGSYLDKLGMSHRVTFLNDLSVEITQLGKDLDFDNLSRGERNRLILGLSFAFRDVWESLYDSINLLFIDELVDSGMDASGVENALSVLKSMSRDRGKNVFLISHREDLASRVNNILRVVKESGFTSFSNELEFVQ